MVINLIMDDVQGRGIPSQMLRFLKLKTPEGISDMLLCIGRWLDGFYSTLVSDTLISSVLQRVPDPDSNTVEITIESAWRRSYSR